MTIPAFAAKFSAMSAAEIIKEIYLASPKLIGEPSAKFSSEIANENPDVALCNESAAAGARLLDSLEDEDGSSASR